VEEMMPGFSSEKDSLDKLQLLARNWVKKQLILEKVSVYLPEEKQSVEKQVQDYRESLLTALYEEELVRQKLDTMISSEELKQVYLDKKANFLLRSAAFQIYYIIVVTMNPKTKDMSKQECIREVADLNQINRCIESLNEVEGSVDRLVDILKLTANDVRLKILYLLSKENQLCPCDLGDILDMSIPAVSQHLRKLKDGGLVETERDGQVIFYSLNPLFKDILAPNFEHINENNILEVLAA
jgi:DNA-binding transcriptional ArsR family regulator